MKKLASFLGWDRWLQQKQNTNKKTSILMGLKGCPMKYKTLNYIWISDNNW